MEKIVELFGEKVKGKDGDVNTADLCGDKKYIGVYFSAHWCPPCRAFTPHLATRYSSWKKDNKPFEVIFVSSDRDQASFDDYYKEMPWLTVPYDDEERRTKLSDVFEVEGIPTLVILCGKTGKVIREDATGDVEGEEFPEQAWSTEPVKLPDLMGEKVIGKDGDVAISNLAGKAVGLYFSAHWCPPCRGFTPVLAEKYKKWKEAGKNFEIVFVSSDRDQASFDEYYKEMPWLAIPFSDRTKKQALGSKFGVSGIPMLVILNGDTGEIITKNGRASVMEDEFPSEFEIQKS